METRANYVLIGLFTLAVIVGAFGFIYWFNTIGGAGTGIPSSLASRPAFGGDDISAAVGAIADATPTWRTAIMAALATFQGEVITP